MDSKIPDTPPALDFVERFMNTVDFGRKASDDLGETSAMQAWLAGRGFDAELSDEDAERIRGFREALRALLESHAGHGEEKLAWQQLEAFVRPVRFRFSTQPVGFVPEGSAADRVIGAAMASVYEARERGTFDRLKVCAESSCRWAFYDRSKNGSGRWCSMAVCGNRNKARRRRARTP